MLSRFLRYRVIPKRSSFFSNVVPFAFNVAPCESNVAPCDNIILEFVPTPLCLKLREVFTPNNSGSLTPWKFRSGHGIVLY